ncbi:PadR family transcriptional regulator [Nocardioides sp. HB32]
MSLLHRGSLDLCVLAVLREEPLHAYGVVQRLAEHGFLDVSYGTVYPLVTRLRRLGMVQQHAARGRGGPVRNVLSLTPEGRTALRRWTDQWRAHQGRVSALLDSTAESAERSHAG